MKDFIFLNQRVNNNEIVYLDTASTSHKPRVVIDSLKKVYTNSYSNIHRSAYYLATEVTEKYERSREAISCFIGSKYLEEVIFTKGTTESINLVAYSLLGFYFKQGDEILITQMEHHSNIVPWHAIAQRKKLKIKCVPISCNGELVLEALVNLITKKTKLLAFTQCSNVLGTVNPMEKMMDIAVTYGIPVLVDGAQYISHACVDMKKLRCDFFVFSSHKLYGPSGVGVLYINKRWHNIMTPYQFGSNMVDVITISRSTFITPPYKFECGTPNIVDTIVLADAISYLNSIGMSKIFCYERTLFQYAMKKLSTIQSLKLIGESNSKCSIVSFIIKNIHSSDIGAILDSYGICLRTGHHCAQPILHFFCIESVIRVSFGIYNTLLDIDKFVICLKKAVHLLQ
jgi:cysteine desulfurase/selenocysteine lyase